MNQDFDWAIIGAGPSGMAAVGLLLDAGVEARRILWIDPEFQVGDFGTAWRHVLSNTPADSFLKYWKASAAFGFAAERERFFLDQVPAANTCPLAIVAQPLRWVTQRLRAQVHSVAGKVVRITALGTAWRLTLASDVVLQARKVVLAIGAEPKRLPFPDLAEISLAAALDPALLKQQVQATDRVAVFGDAQSARSVLGNFRTLKVQRLVHFYHSRQSVRRHFGTDEFSFAESLPATPARMIETIPHCDKAIYAIGFARRSIRIDGLPNDFRHDPDTGIIAPGLYGLGIAFPEILRHEHGRAEYHVTALQPVMIGLRRRLPAWLEQ